MSDPCPDTPDNLTGHPDNLTGSRKLHRGTQALGTVLLAVGWVVHAMAYLVTTRGEWVWRGAAVFTATVTALVGLHMMFYAHWYIGEETGGERA